MKLVTTHKQLAQNENLNKKFKNILKSFLINKVLPNKFEKQDQFIIYPFWHHVFTDEIKNLNLKLIYENYWDFK